MKFTNKQKRLNRLCKIIKLFFSILIILKISPLQAEVFDDVLVQSPSLNNPEAGSVVGSLANTLYGPSDLLRGTYVLPSPFELPDERGSVLMNIFPTYSPEGGITEWGMGWQNNLCIKRFKTLGTIKYDDSDEFISPWGILKLGDDGNYYIAGLTKKVKFSLSVSGWTAVDENGTRYLFDEVITTTSGGYAWYLTDVLTIIEGSMTLNYTSNSSGYIYLESVYYGNLDYENVYRVKFEYSALDVSFNNYYSSKKIELDKKIDRILVESRNFKTSDYEVRWTYDLDYEKSPVGPAFYLISVQRTFPSFKSDNNDSSNKSILTPVSKGFSSLFSRWFSASKTESDSTDPVISPEIPVTYEYDYGQTEIESANFEYIEELDEIIATEGELGIKPNKASFVDMEKDGLVDFEHSTNHTLFRHTEFGWEREEIVRDAAADRRCLPDPSILNKPRGLVRMNKNELDPKVVKSYNIGAARTELLVCNRNGSLMYENSFGGSFELGPKKRMVDINRDFKPDIISVWRNSYQILENRGDETSYDFVVRASGRLNRLSEPAAVWIYDINGDGIVDIVAKLSSSIKIYYGKGNFDFDLDGESFILYNDRGRPLSLSAYGLSFLDANNDGLTDIFASNNSYGFLYMNHGNRFVKQPLPGISDIGWSFRNPVVVDLSGGGSIEIVITRDGHAYGLKLNRPGTGIMKNANDGKGTKLNFEYRRADVTPWIEHKLVMLDRMTIESSGYEDMNLNYNYEDPILHSAARFLVGYNTTRRNSILLSQEVNFFNDDDVAGVVLSDVYQDTDAGYYKFIETDYESLSFEGVLFLRQIGKREGYRNLDESLDVSFETEFLAYERVICPISKRTTTRHGVLNELYTIFDGTGLADSMHCLPETSVTTGIHTDIELDFTHSLEIGRNEIGQITSVTAINGMDRLILQEMGYDSNHRINHISKSGLLGTEFLYDPATGLLAGVYTPDGVAAKVKDIDSRTIDVLQVDKVRGSSIYKNYFSYDKHERLYKSWDNLGISSKDNPLESIEYIYAMLDAPAQIKKKTLKNSKVKKQKVMLKTAKGEEIANLIKSYRGWVVGKMIQRNPELGEATNFYRELLRVSDEDLNELDYLELNDSASATLINQKNSNGYGNTVYEWNQIQAGVTNNISGVAGIIGEDLVETKTENGVYSINAGMDSQGKVLWSENQDGNVSSYVYDALGRIVGITLPDGSTHKLQYDNFGRPETVTRDGAAQIRYAYYPDTGLLESKTILSSISGPGILPIIDRMVTYEYDAIGRVIAEFHSLEVTGETRLYTYEYDGENGGDFIKNQQGFLTNVEGDDFKRVMTYNKKEENDSIVLSLSDWRTVTEKKSFYEDGTVKEVSTVVIDNDSESELHSVNQEYYYDSFGRFYKMYLNGLVLFKVYYDDENRMNRILFRSGDSIEYNYDSTTYKQNGYIQQTYAGSSSRSGSAALDNTFAMNWNLNDRGFVQREEFSIGDTIWHRDYTYNSRGYLAGSVDEEQSSSYTYNSTGLLNTISDTQGFRTLFPGSLTRDIGGVIYEYDSLGRVIRKADDLYSYGPDGNLVEVVNPTHTYEYIYDETGNRLVKKQDGVPVAGYLPNGYLDETNFILSVNIGGRLVGIIENGVFKMLNTDPRGTQLGDFIEPNICTPYGVRLSNPEYYAAIDYVTKGYDDVLKTVRMGVRDYDPYLGQFTTPDPLFLENIEKCAQNPDDCNLYSYAKNNPLSYVDLNGMEPVRTVLNVPFIQQIDNGGHNCWASAFTMKIWHDRNPNTAPGDDATRRITHSIGLADLLNSGNPIVVNYSGAPTEPEQRIIANTGLTRTTLDRSHLTLDRIRGFLENDVSFVLGADFSRNFLHLPARRGRQATHFGHQIVVTGIQGDTDSPDQAIVFFNDGREGTRQMSLSDFRDSIRNRRGGDMIIYSGRSSTWRERADQ